MITCPSCGKQNQDHFKFCLTCGAKLPVAAPPLAPTPVPPPAAVPPPSAAPPGMAPGAAPAWGAPPPPSAYPPPPSGPGPSAAPGGYAAPPPPVAPPSAPVVMAPPPVAGVPAAGGADTKACGQCGAQNPAHFMFCGTCGNKLLAPAPAAPPPSAAPARGPEPGVGSARTMFVDASQMPGFPGAGGVTAPPVAPAPAPVIVEHSVRLALLREDGSDGGVLNLVGGPQRLGRAHGPPFDQDAYLDPDHADISAAPNGVLIDDLGSLNGVFYRLYGKTELRHGDVFRVGQELLLYEDLPEAEAMPDGTEVMGSPNPGYWGRVSLIVEPGRAIFAYPIRDEGFTIGRERGDITFPEDGYVSGTHCRVVASDEGIHLEDLGSSNGTYVRVRRGDVVPHGSTILIGQQIFRVDPPA